MSYQELYQQRLQEYKQIASLYLEKPLSKLLINELKQENKEENEKQEENQEEEIKLQDENIIKVNKNRLRTQKMKMKKKSKNFGDLFVNLFSFNNNNNNNKNKKKRKNRDNDDDNDDHDEDDEHDNNNNNNNNNNNIHVNNLNEDINTNEFKNDSQRNYTFLTRTSILGRIFDDYDQNYYNLLCKSIENNETKADFDLIFLIRLLFIMKKSDNQTMVNEIENKLRKFRFWPTSKDPLNDVSFWSENHTFMYLTSAYLYVQEFGPNKGNATERDTHHLLSYLNGHNKPNNIGVYEVLSCTYLPYTICALLNLVDFAINREVRNKARTLIKNIIRIFALVTNKDGICNLTASARQKPKLRLSNYGHNINQLIYLLTGKTVDIVKPTPIIDFLLTSKWHPTNAVYKNFMLGENNSNSIISPNAGHFENIKMNHNTGKTHEMYVDSNISKEDATPFYWSAGLLAHPKYITYTINYISKYQLQDCPGIKSFSNYAWIINLPGASEAAQLIARQKSHQSKGQNYTSIDLNIYKSPTRKIVMTSFPEYNVGYKGYQQMPWMVNFDGLGIWSQSGKLGKNYHNICGPSIKQSQNILLGVYSIHSEANEGSISFFWPSNYFQNERIDNQEINPPTNYENLSESTINASWWFGHKNNCYVGLYCNKPSVIDTSEDNSEEDSEKDPQDFSEENLKVNIQDENLEIDTEAIPENANDEDTYGDDLNNSTTAESKTTTTSSNNNNNEEKKKKKSKSHTSVKYGGDQFVTIPRRKVENRRVYWIVVVGDEKTHGNFDDFISYCHTIQHNAESNKNETKLTVNLNIDTINLQIKIDLD